MKAKEHTKIAWEGASCRVRSFRRADAAGLYAFARMPSVSKYMNWQPHASIEETRRYLEGVCRRAHHMDTPLAIACKEDDRCCGFVGFTHYEAHHRRAELAIATSPEVQGRGIAKEACQFLLERARALGLMRLQAIVEQDNAASKRLMERLGGQQEALLKRYLVAKSGIVDAYLYAFYL